MDAGSSCCVRVTDVVRFPSQGRFTLHVAPIQCPKRPQGSLCHIAAFLVVPTAELRLGYEALKFCLGFVCCACVWKSESFVCLLRWYRDQGGNVPLQDLMLCGAGTQGQAFSQHCAV